MPPRCSYAVLALRLAWFAHLATLSYGATELSTTNLIATAVTNIGEDEEAPADVSEEARRQTKCFAVKSCKSGSKCEQTRCQACEDKCDKDGTQKPNTRRGRRGRLACDFYRNFCKNHRDEARDEVCKRDKNAMDNDAFRLALKNKDMLAKVADWNVCKVTDFSNAFFFAKTFTSDLSKWDVSKGTDFRYMFAYASKFTSDLSKWDVSKGTDFRQMFAYAYKFTSDLSKWDISKGTDFYGMFGGAKTFTSDLSKWDVSKGTDFKYMFAYASKFTSDLSKWDVSKGTDFKYMFASASKFTSDLSKWDVSKGTDFKYMFGKATAFRKHGCKVPTNGKATITC